MTKISLPKEVLLQALKKVKEVIDKKPTLSVLSNVLFKVDGKSLQLISSDNEVTIVVQLELSEDIAATAFLLPFDFTYKAIELVNGDTVTIEAKKTSAAIVGVNDRSEVNKLDKVETFVELPQFPDSHTATVGAEFIACLAHALNTVDEKIQGHFANYTLIDFTGSGAAVVSTTGSALYCMGFEVDVKETCKLLVRAKVVKILKGFSATTISWSDNHMAFKSDNVTIMAKRPEAKFPDYTRLLPKETLTGSFLVKRAEFINAMKKAELSSNGKGATMLLKSQIGSIVVEATDEDSRRKIRAEVAGDYPGEVEAITVLPDTMLKVLEQTSFEELSITIIAANKGIFLTAPSAPAYTGMVMPMVKTDKK